MSIAKLSMPGRDLPTTVFAMFCTLILTTSPLPAWVVVSNPVRSNLTAVGTASPVTTQWGVPPASGTRQISPAAISGK